MLKGIPKILSPELLKVLAEMGHSDRLVISDGNFPAESMGKDAIVIRCDGHGVPEILDAILQVFPLDSYGIHIKRLSVNMMTEVMLLLETLSVLHSMMKLRQLMQSLQQVNQHFMRM